MKIDWIVWLGCVLLFGAGVILGLAPAGDSFYKVENIHDFFEIIAAIATVTAVVVAVLSVNAWKSQMRDTADHDLARKILVSAYEYREAIKAIRSPVIMSYEASPEAGEKAVEDPKLESFRGECRAYQRRFSRAEPIRVRLLTYSLEAEVVWGEELKDYLIHLMRLETEISIFLRSHLIAQDPSSPDDSKKAHSEILLSKRDALMDDFSEEGDAFTQDMKKRLSKIEQFLKEKLIR
ncbi:hypothetical protein GCM10009504_08040 [Pseudomonas laurentiana]|uniref:DUF4760 domain-containing protein n=1 Tax=Pseudomonas laurentiana TaxID=2364649 RepID=A0A6I5RUD4_9PSED|nr:hypothetical protein [Pseudomonas laurentiana]NES11359.1 hypothetical protein [Pseudomonas laurentiana]GGU53649.1 hypothetical protein GCM10009504_08040 [Pseudomonas laurentiana]